MRIIAQNGPANWRLISKLVFNIRGRNELVDMHTHDSDLSHFNENGWREFYLAVAELLELNPGIPGVMGVSWFFDSQLSMISPRLAYLFSMPLQGGAVFVPLPTTRKDIALATKTSWTCRELCERGDYLPRPHFVAWGRSAMMRWARSQ